MKRQSLVVLFAALGLLAACTPEAPVAEKVYFGIGAQAKYALKGTAPLTTVQTDVTFVGVLFDADGKVLDANLDVMQVKAVATDATTSSLKAGVAVNADTDTKSKWELGDDYGMGETATKGEWYVQADAWENYVVGKTVVEVAAGLEDAALLASVSIGTEDFSAVLTEAWEHRAGFITTEVANINVGIGMYGLHEAKKDSVSLAGAAFVGDVVVASKIDVFQVPYVITNVGTEEAPSYALTVNETSKQTDVANTAIKSKLDLGPNYGMGATATQGEWNIQAAKLEAFVLDQTVAAAFANVTETGEFTDPTIAGVSIGVEDFKLVYTEAYNGSTSVTR